MWNHGWGNYFFQVSYYTTKIIFENENQNYHTGAIVSVRIVENANHFFFSQKINKGTQWLNRVSKVDLVWS